MRNFFIHDDCIIALAKYNKSQSMTERPKVISRYIFPAPSHLYIAYDADVLPFMQMFQLDGITPPETIIINHVWSDANNKPRETHHVSDILGRESTKVLGVRLTLLSLSLWCNIGIAMDQELLQNAFSRLLKDNKFMAHTLQAGHTRDGENHHYTLSVDMLQGTFTQTLCAFSQVCRLWHDLLGLSEGFDVTKSVPKSLAVKCRDRPLLSAMPQAMDEAGPTRLPNPAPQMIGPRITPL